MKKEKEKAEWKTYRIVKRRGWFMPQKLFWYVRENMLYVPCDTLKEAEQEIEYDKDEWYVVWYY